MRYGVHTGNNTVEKVVIPRLWSRCSNFNSGHLILLAPSPEQFGTKTRKKNIALFV